MQSLQAITTKELRDNLAEILEKVAIGQQSFLVSKFGREKALIVPVVADMEKGEERAKKNLRDLAACGMWKDRKDIKDSAGWISNLRRKQSLRIRD